MPDRGSIGINVGQAHELIYNLLMGFPVPGETAQMRNDEIHVRILSGKHLGHLRLPAYIYQYRQTKRTGGIANLPVRHGLKTMYFNAAKPPASNGLPDH